ncbi:oligosaccharide flippase family protein [Bacillus toyonensis]|uniref:oligosaccharide flippase family protein n=1 Tax=Bacillus toyonensis TaxID=155322 RepID=UPI003D64F809
MDLSEEKKLPNRNAPLTLKRNFFYTATANLIYAFSQWLIILLMAKLGSVEMVGQYSLGLAVTAPVFLFLNMNLRSIQATDTQNSYEFTDYFINRVITSFAGIIIVSIISLLEMFSDQTRVIILLMGLSRFFESLCDVSYGLYQQRERMDYLAVSKIIQSILAILLVTLSMMIFENLVCSVIFYCLTFLFVLIAYDFRKIRLLVDFNACGLLKRTSKFSNVKGLIILGLPLGIVSSLDTFNANLPRYFIQYFLNEEALGYFSSIAFIMSTGATVINALAHSSIPRLSNYYRENYELFKKLLFQLICLGVLIGGGGILISYIFGEYILNLIYTSAYSHYNNVFIIIMVAGLIWYVTGFISSALTATREFKAQVPIHVITTVVTAVSSVLLIPKYALIGAAIIVCISNTCRFILTLVTLNKIVSKNLKRGIERCV